MKKREEAFSVIYTMEKVRKAKNHKDYDGKSVLAYIMDYKFEPCVRCTINSKIILEDLETKKFNTLEEAIQWFAMLGFE